MTSSPLQVSATNQPFAAYQQATDALAQLLSPKRRPHDSRSPRTTSPQTAPSSSPNLNFLIPVTPGVISPIPKSHSPIDVSPLQDSTIASLDALLSGVKSPIRKSGRGVQKGRAARSIDKSATISHSSEQSTGKSHRRPQSAPLARASNREASQPFATYDEAINALTQLTSPIKHALSKNNLQAVGVSLIIQEQLSRSDRLPDDRIQLNRKANTRKLKVFSDHPAPGQPPKLETEEHQYLPRLDSKSTHSLQLTPQKFNLTTTYFTSYQRSSLVMYASIDWDSILFKYSSLSSHKVTSKISQSSIRPTKSETLASDKNGWTSHYTKTSVIERYHHIRPISLIARGHQCSAFMPMDLILSVEHRGFDCICHPEVHHKLISYARHAEFVLSHLAESACKLFAIKTVCAIRYCNQPWTNNCRAGSFEVMMACRPPSLPNSHTPEVLYSQLGSNNSGTGERWPDLKALESKMMTLLRKYFEPRHSPVDDQTSLRPIFFAIPVDILSYNQQDRREGPPLGAAAAGTAAISSYPPPARQHQCSLENLKFPNLLNNTVVSQLRSPASIKVYLQQSPYSSQHFPPVVSVSPMATRNSAAHEEASQLMNIDLEVESSMIVVEDRFSNVLAISCNQTSRFLVGETIRVPGRFVDPGDFSHLTGVVENVCQLEFNRFVLSVRVVYLDAVIDVPEIECLATVANVNAKTNSTALASSSATTRDKVKQLLPSSLDLLMILLAIESNGQDQDNSHGNIWQEMDIHDIVCLSAERSSCEVFLARRSLFCQLRSHCLRLQRTNVLGLFKASNQTEQSMVATTSTVIHPITGELVDLQHAYSEEVLDWCRDHCGVKYNGGLGNAYLVDLCRVYDFGCDIYHHAIPMSYKTKS